MTKPDRSERRARYAAAMDAVTGGTCPTDLIDAVMGVADTELMQAQAEAYQYRTALQGAARKAAVSAVVPPADRAAVLREAAQRLYTALFPAVYDDLGQKAAEGVNRAVSELRRMADTAELRRVAGETQQPETQADGGNPLTITADGDGVLLHLPEITYLDTQVWSADIGLTTSNLLLLREAATAYLHWKAQQADVCGAWGGCPLPRGHNRGQADIPENHRAAPAVVVQPAEPADTQTARQDPAPDGPELDDPTQCSGEEGFCPEHGFHRHSLKQNTAVARSGQPETDDEAFTPRCDHCKQPGHSFEDCPHADEEPTP